MKVSLLVMDPLKNLIITGSEDKSLFFFKFLTSDKGIDMDPIRCVTLDFVAINFEWLSSKVIVIYYTYKGVLFSVKSQHSQKFVQPLFLGL